MNRLISVAVVTYNSAKTVLETLESVKKQTYTNIELIISDDCSTDNTVGVCRDWLNENAACFVNATLLTSEVNKGIAPNRNNCINAAQGEWLKFVDGDDLLTPNSIEDYNNAIKDDMHFIMGNFTYLYDDGKTKEYIPQKDFFNWTAAEQYRSQEKGATVLWPGIIHRRETLLKLGGLDERFPMLDDFPLITKILENDYKFHHLDSFIFVYRVHAGSAQRSKGFHYSHVNYVNKIVIYRLKRDKKYFAYWHDKLWSTKELAKLSNNKLKASGIYCLMLLTDCIEWKYLLKNNIYRPLIFKYRTLKSSKKDG